MRHSMLLAVLCSSALLHAQEFSPSLKWSGNVRVRSELDMRDFDLKTPGNGYTLLRARFGAEAQPVENVRVVLQAQDSRVFGQERDGAGAFNTLADTRNLDLHQGYIEVRRLFSNNLMLRVGRQELIYGNERMIGAVGWNNVGRTFDGAMLRLEWQSFSADVLAMNVGEVQLYTPVATPPAVQSVRDSGADLYGAYGMLKGFPNHTIDGYFLYQWDRNQTVAGSDDLRRFTAGTFLRGTLTSFDYEAELAYQGGRRRGVDVEAYLLAGAVGYTRQGWAFRLGYDHLSGSSPGSSIHRSFDPMFHTGHKFYGYMDYFIAVPAHTADRGLTDLYLRSTLPLSESTSASIWIHQFSHEKEVAGKKGLGQEVDCVLLYKYNSAVAFELGASAFLPDELMRQRFGGAGTSFWGYLAATVAF